METLERTSFIAPFSDANSTDKGHTKLETERDRLARIEREDEQRVAADAVDYRTEVAIKRGMAAESLLQRRTPQYRIPLDELADSAGKHECQKGFDTVEDVSLPYESTFSGNRKIPRIVHQTSRNRCLTTKVYGAAASWKLGHEWAYYFHDDDAIDRLFQQDWPEFPHLQMILSCIGNSGTLKADIWRYLILWEYGGVYADVDTKPKLFNFTSITPEDDGFFTVEMYHLLSQYFMALSPRHRKFTISHI